MPKPKNLVALLEDLQKAKSADDSDKLCKVLDIFMASSEVTMDFVVNAGGKVVKALRGSQDEQVRKKAIELTSQWKTLVAGQLADAEKKKGAKKKQEVKEEDAGSENEAGASAGAAIDALPASTSASKIPAPGQLARPRQNVVLKGDGRVLKERVRGLNCKVSEVSPLKGKAVVYWMSRDQRVEDNWAMLYAQQCALEADAPLAVCFSLVQEFLGAGLRHFGFMLRGLAEVEAECQALGIPFFLLRGNAQDTIPAFVQEHQVGLLVTDYCPIRVTREWRDGVADKLKAVTPVLEVDAHNIVPVWEASDKLEVAARTIRPKITKQLPKYLTDFPEVSPQTRKWTAAPPSKIEWEQVLTSLKCDASVPEVEWATPGAKAGLQNLEQFLTKRIGKFDSKRNDPNEEACSDMSPWLHFGQVSAQRCVLEAKVYSKKYNEAVASFVEEIVVRRELSDNFCHYNRLYDSLKGCAQWAQDSLQLHASDKRPYVYSLEQLESAKTHDELWNAAQKEMVHRGKMHGFMRMYWAKKILEWTRSPEDALKFAIFLNDRYNLDGRDPNGFVGCMWSIGGIHDMGWKERAIFGKIRYMNYDGCKRKFNIAAYTQKISRLVAATLKKVK